MLLFFCFEQFCPHIKNRCPAGRTICMDPLACVWPLPEAMPTCCTVAAIDVPIWCRSIIVWTHWLLPRGISTGGSYARLSIHITAVHCSTLVLPGLRKDWSIMPKCPCTITCLTKTTWHGAVTCIWWRKDCTIHWIKLCGTISGASQHPHTDAITLKTNIYFSSTFTQVFLLRHHSVSRCIRNCKHVDTPHTELRDGLHCICHRPEANVIFSRP